MAHLKPIIHTAPSAVTIRFQDGTPTDIAVENFTLMTGVCHFTFTTRQTILADEMYQTLKKLIETDEIEECLDEAENIIARIENNLI